jgi:MFS family permease
MRGFGKVSAFGILFSCVSDVVPVEQRGKLYGQTMGVGMAAIIIGPMFSLLLNAEWCFRVSGFLALLVILYLAFLMPETLWIGLRRMEAQQQQVEDDAKAAGSTDDAPTASPEPSPSPDPETEDLNTSLLSSPHGDSMTPRVVYPVTRTVNSAVAADSDSVDDAPLVRSISFSASPDVPPAILAVPPRPASMNPCTALKLAFTSPAHRNLAIIIFFSQMSQNGIMTCAMMYLKYHLHLTSDDNSKLLLAMGGWAVVVMIIILPLMLRKRDEKFVLLFALAMDFVHQMMYLSGHTMNTQRFIVD